MVTIQYNGQWLDTDGDTRLVMKWTNNLLERKSPELLHTLELSVPYTTKNAAATNNDFEPEFGGDRFMVSGIVSDDGVILHGNLGAVSATEHRISLLFVYGRNTDFYDRTIGDLIRQRGWMQLVFEPKGQELPNYTYDYDFTNYNNGTHDNGSVQASITPLTMPCVNLGFLIQEAAEAVGYAVRVDGQYIDSMSYDDPTNPFFYIFKLPTANVRTMDDVTISRHVPTDPNWDNYDVVVTRNGVVIPYSDAGLSFRATKYRLGSQQMRWTVYALRAIRDMRLIFPERTFEDTDPVGDEGRPFITRMDGIRKVPSNSYGEIDVQAGTFIGFLRHTQWNNTLGFYLRQARMTDTATADYTFHIVREGVPAAPGEAIDVAANLPEMSLAEVIKAFCDIIMGGYYIDPATMTIEISSFSNISANPDIVSFSGKRVVEHSQTTRYIDGYSKNNIMNTDGGTFERNFTQNTDLVDGDRTIATIPFSSGEDYGNGEVIFTDDVTISDNGDITYGGHPGIMCRNAGGGRPLHLSCIDSRFGISIEFNAFVSTSTQIRIKVLRSFVEFMRLRENTVVEYRGLRWMVKNSTWSDGVEVMELCSIS